VAKSMIVITGTPGVGKTVTAKRVSEMRSMRLLELGALAQSGAISGKDEARESLIIDPRKLRAAIRRALKGTVSDFIAEGHYGEIVPAELVKKAIVIRLDPIELESRLRERGYSERKVRENVQAEILDSCLIGAVEAFGQDRVVEIDSTGLGEDALAKAVSDAIDGSAGALPGTVNWIAKLEKDGKIAKLLQ